MKLRLLGVAALACLGSSAAEAALTMSVVANVHRSVAIAQPPNDPNRLFIVSQGLNGVGSIYVVKDGLLLSTPFLQVGPIQDQNEQGLLGLAFDPNYSTNRYFYIYHTDSAGDSRVVRYQSNAGNPDLADPASAFLITRIDQEFVFHQGGSLRFSADGYLCIGLGDGGHHPEAQNPQNIWGKIIKIDPYGDDFPLDPDRNYRIPSSNPFPGSPVWSYGLRNPWKWSFDLSRRNGFGGMVICDVGQDSWEEMDYEPPNSPGLNYGWSVYEGSHYMGFWTGTPPYVNPVYEYPHPDGFAISGGAICRDPRLGIANWGRAFFADWAKTWVKSVDLNFDPETGTVVPGTALDHGLSAGSIVGIEEDIAGHLYLVRNSGIVNRLSESNPSRTASGTVDFGTIDDAVRPRGVRFEILDANGSTAASLTAGIPSDGHFVIPVLTGSYRLSVQIGTWLRRTIPFSTTSSDAVGLNFQLVNGDADGDNEVGLSDFGRLSASFGLLVGDAGFDANADFDRDGEVGLSDFGILSSSFGQLGD